MMSFPASFDNRERLFVLVLMIIIFGVYLLTLPRTLALEDDGLFLMSSYYFGIAHPPGYPLYTLLSGLFGQLPVGSFPSRIHAFSGLAAAFACVLLYLFSRSLKLPPLAAMAVALCYAFSRNFWAQAIIAEVYTLNACLVLLLFLIAILIRQPFHADDNSEKETPAFLVYLFALTLGLSLAAHIPLVVLSVPSLAILLWPARRVFIQHLGKCIAFGLVGLVPYVWMIWRSNTDVPINFYGSISSWSDFIYIFSREGYVQVDISQTAGLADKLAYMNYMLEQIVAQFSLVGLAVASLGFVVQWWRWPRAVCVSLTLLFLFHSVFFLLVIFFDYDYLSRAVFSVYPMLAYAVMAIWLGLALYFAVDWLLIKLRCVHFQKPVLFIISVSLAVIVLMHNWNINNRQSYTWADDYARAVLNNLPQDAELFVSGDIHTFTLGYMHHVEGIRPDIDLYNFQGLIFSNRLFHPVKTSDNEKLAILEQHVTNTERPVCTVEGIESRYKQSDSWLFSCFASNQSEKFTLRLNEDIKDYFEKVRTKQQTDPWTIYHQQQLRKKMAASIGRTVAHNKNEEAVKQIGKEYLKSDFYSALGYLEGMNTYLDDYGTLNEMIRVIKSVEVIPPLAKKHEKASYYNIRGDVSFMANNVAHAVKEYELSIDTWPDKKNPSIKKLLGIYRKQDQLQAFSDLKNRFM